MTIIKVLEQEVVQEPYIYPVTLVKYGVKESQLKQELDEPLLSLQLEQVELQGTHIFGVYVLS